MPLRPLRIRHYIGTIVAACSLGGLLLAFQFAWRFQSLEDRSQEQREKSNTMIAVEDLERDVGDWLRGVREGLYEVSRLPVQDERLDGLLVRLQTLRDRPENRAEIGTPADYFGHVGKHLDRMREGVREVMSRGLKAGELDADSLKLFLSVQERVEKEVAAAFSRKHEDLQAGLGNLTEDLETRRDELWRTVGIYTALYALVVLLLWRWVSARLLRPLQALTRESRRTLNGETAFRLQPDGPHEVRLLTESLSTLVGNLVGARSHLEEKVQERTLELERASRAKNEFLANMSHEIRTPMTAILGYAELCLAPDIPETDRRRYAQIIHANGEHLLSVINDILDVSKIEAGRMTVEPTVCSPFEVVAEMRSLMDVRAREKGLGLSVESLGDIPVVVRTDPTRLRQILLNLLNNAIKFTDEGGIVLRFGMESGPDGERLAFEVEDSGVGLSAEQLQRVFHPFEQADTSTTRKYGGSGLGLTISKTLANLLGGDLVCTSEVGKGSTFRVTIDPGPLDGVSRKSELPEGETLAPPSPLPVAGPGPDLRGRVLLAEDVAVNRRLISTILLRAGIRVDEAENGKVAVDKALTAREAGSPFDIVFMDMQMPEMDGYEATRKLRETGYLRPIVALTSHSMNGERQRCLDAGCDEYMTKPIDRLVLLQVLSRFLPTGEAEEHVAA